MPIAANRPSSDGHSAFFQQKHDDSTKTEEEDKR
jgi:hypothetical protein